MKVRQYEINSAFSVIFLPKKTTLRQRIEWYVSRTNQIAALGYVSRTNQIAAFRYVSCTNQVAVLGFVSCTNHIIAFEYPVPITVLGYCFLVNNVMDHGAVNKE